jgi:hypothetical protein
LDFAAALEQTYDCGLARRRVIRLGRRPHVRRCPGASPSVDSAMNSGCQPPSRTAAVGTPTRPQKGAQRELTRDAGRVAILAVVGFLERARSPRHFWVTCRPATLRARSDRGKTGSALQQLPTVVSEATQSDAARPVEYTPRLSSLGRVLHCDGVYPGRSPPFLMHKVAPPLSGATHKVSAPRSLFFWGSHPPSQCPPQG